MSDAPTHLDLTEIAGTAAEYRYFTPIYNSTLLDCVQKHLFNEQVMEGYFVASLTRVSATEWVVEIAADVLARTDAEPEAQSDAEQ